jgi:cobalt-zinc-cadmium efflux system outer membrane protein
MKSYFVWIIGFCLLSSPIIAQSSDSLKISISDAEQQFVKNNLTLLAQKYNIEASKAAIIQAKLLPNPEINIEQTLNTTPTIANDAMIGAFGQRAFQVQQLIQLAGKRNKQVNIAKINAEITDYQFFEILRGLSYQLRTSFYAIHFLQKTLTTYEQEIVTLARLISAYQEQVLKGNVPQKEVIRLQSFLVTLETERSSILMDIADNQATFKVLIGDISAKPIEPIVDEKVLGDMDLDNLKLADLTNTATDGRFDRKMQEATVRLASANLALQKSLATPDITVGYSYDRAGSYLNNYHALTVSMSLPIFNKNQGNIKIAENEILANKQYLAQTDVQITNDVLQALLKAKEAERLYRTLDKNYLPSFNKLIDGVIENYQKRNVTLIEFTDFLESYKNTVSQINSLNNTRIQAFENLNFVVGKKVL